MPDILYEDNHILVVCKPAGLAVQNASFGKKDLESMLRNYLAEKENRSNPQLYVVHRLDQPVQGIMVFAKDEKSVASLCAQVTDGRMKKTYLAVTDGIPREASAELIHYLKRDGRTNTSRVVDAKMPGAKKASLNYKVLRTIKEDEKAYALLEVQLHTGRHHQIRVQMAAMGTPLAGDRKYNPKAETDTGIGLCAWRLTLLHPKTKKEMSFTCTPSGNAFKKFKTE